MKTRDLARIGIPPACEELAKQLLQRAQQDQLFTTRKRTPTRFLAALDDNTEAVIRELEVLEKVSEKANLTVVLGEKGLADRVVKLL